MLKQKNFAYLLALAIYLGVNIACDNLTGWLAPETLPYMADSQPYNLVPI